MTPSSLNRDQILGLNWVSLPEILHVGGHVIPGRSWIRSMPAYENLREAKASGSSFLAPGFLAGSLSFLNWDALYTLKGFGFDRG